MKAAGPLTNTTLNCYIAVLCSLLVVANTSNYLNHRKSNVSQYNYNLNYLNARFAVDPTIREQQSITMDPTKNATNKTHIEQQSIAMEQNIQQQINTLITYEIPRELAHDDIHTRKIFKQKNGFDLLRLFQHKKILFHGDSIISLFTELLFQTLFYCTPSKLDINVTNIDYIRRKYTSEALHPCGPHFCDFIWNHTLFVIDGSATIWQQCMLSKMGGGWSNNQHHEFMDALQRNIKIGPNKNIHCQILNLPLKYIQVYYCNEYLKYEHINSRINASNVEDFVHVPYDVIVDEMGLMHVFQSMPSRMFETNAIKKIHSLSSIIESKIMYHSLYDKNKTKCYIFMSMDPVCSSYTEPEFSNKRSRVIGENAASLKWKEIQTKLGLNHTFAERFNLSMLSSTESDLVASCVKDTKKDFDSLNMNFSTQYMKEYCIKFAFLDDGAKMVSNYVAGLVANQTAEFVADNVYFYDHHKIFNNIADRCEAKHHCGKAHSCGYYTTELVIFLNLFDLTNCFQKMT